MGWVAWAWAALKWIKGLLPPALLEYFLKAFGVWADSDVARLRVEAEVEIAAIGAELAARQAAAQVLLAEHGWAVTRWIRPAFAYPLAAYYAAIVADKLLHFGWEAEPLPEPIGAWSGTIITAYFLVRGFEKSMRWFKRH